MMTRVGEDGRAPGILLNFGASSTPWLVRASLTTAEPEAVFLIQLAPIAPAPAIRRDIAFQDALIERLPDGFVWSIRPESCFRPTGRFSTWCRSPHPPG